VPNGSSTSRTSSAVGCRGPFTGCTVRSPPSTDSAPRSCTSGWAIGCSATVSLPVRAAQIRKETCWAMVPVGKKAAPAVPSSPATRASNSSTTPSP
jgi:hypothetical protein